ncbi:MAG TPA: hypothetical protein VNW73_01695 [Ktedonobacteraceae bacterium]|nr:hypothetical protein [Ktedonobacteraceae bacterium]
MKICLAHSGLEQKKRRTCSWSRTAQPIEAQISHLTRIPRVRAHRTLMAERTVCFWRSRRHYGSNCRLGGIEKLQMSAGGIREQGRLGHRVGTPSINSSSDMSQ